MKILDNLHTDTRFTYEDYLHFPEDKRYEIINGEVSVVPSPGRSHQDVSRNLEFILWDFVKKNDLGFVYYAPFDVVLSDIDVVQPDLIFVSKEREDIITEKNIQGAPDLVIEILSSSSNYKDRIIKKKLYKRFGVKEFWLVDPKNEQVTITCFGPGDEEESRIYSRGDLLESPLLPGLKINLQDIFERVKDTS